jgi:hypothetical protein
VALAPYGTKQHCGFIYSQVLSYVLSQFHNVRAFVVAYPKRPHIAFSGAWTILSPHRPPRALKGLFARRGPIWCPALRGHLRSTGNATGASVRAKSEAGTHLAATTSRTVASHLYFLSRLPSHASQLSAAARFAGRLDGQFLLYWIHP